MSLSKITETPVPQSSFIDKALDAIPRPVLGLLGIMAGFFILIVFSGMNGALNRVVNAQAARIERSVDSLEVVVTEIKDVAKRLGSIESDVKVLKDKVASIEAENAKYHKGK